MLVDELEQHILAAKAAGKTPVMVNAMCGTTVLGAIDPLDAIADVCRTYGIWMHVDVSMPCCQPYLIRTSCVTFC